MVSELDLSYLAGFFDGDGSIHISKTTGEKTYQFLVVTIAQAGERGERWLRYWRDKLDMGYISRNPRGKNVYFNWDTRGKKAGDLLEMLLPYLRIKKREAEVGLEFRKLKGAAQRFTTISKENQRERDRLENLLREIKKSKHASYKPQHLQVA